MQIEFKDPSKAFVNHFFYKERYTNYITSRIMTNLMLDSGSKDQMDITKQGSI